MSRERPAPARRGDVVSDYHGTRVADPYRWLEDADSTETLAWVEAQNAATSAYLAASPARARLKARLAALWNYPRYSVLQRRGERYFFSRNDGLQNQAVLYVQEGLSGQPRVVLDPNGLSEDGTVALSNQALSHDGALLAYGVSASGSDWQDLRIRTVDGGHDYPETIRWCKFAGIAWTRDNAGFYYNRQPEPGSVPPEDENSYNRVYWHALGTPQHDDLLVHEDAADKELSFTPAITDDGCYLLLTVSRGTSPHNGLYYRSVESAGPFEHLAEEGEAAFDPLEVVGTTLYVHTDLGAPRGRIVAIDLANPGREHWREVVAQGEDAIHVATIVHDRIVVVYLHDAHHRVGLFTLAGDPCGQIPLPGLGAVDDLAGRREDGDLFLAWSSFLQPTSILRYEVASGTLETVIAPRVDSDATAAFETRQVFYTSRDGTCVPMFLTHRKGLVLDGRNPTLLYGYGGFNISQTPTFSAGRLAWLESGGVYAVANLRGGNEYGEEWHQAGMFERKQNVFDDFIAAAEWLIAQGYTSSQRLAIEGGSNGGLLVAACMVQRPELFGAVVCRVPVIDMLRYHHFTVGRYWVPEYGNAEADATQFGYLYAYSPLHNVRSGVHYPPVLIASAESDDRVVPAHAKKFAATLQAAQGGDAPILLRVETRAGHGAGKPITKVIEEQADIYAFLCTVFGLSM